MKINDGIIKVLKKKDGSGYYSKEPIKDKETQEYIKDENGYKDGVYKTVYLPEGVELEHFTDVRFEGYMKGYLRNDGTLGEYISVEKIIEIIQANPRKKQEDNHTFNYSDFNIGTTDDLPF